MTEAAPEIWVARGGPLPVPVPVAAEFRCGVVTLLRDPVRSLKVLGRIDAYRDGLQQVGMSVDQLREIVGRGLQNAVQRNHADGPINGCYALCLDKVVSAAWDAGVNQRRWIEDLVRPGGFDGAVERVLAGGLSANTVKPEACLRHLLDFESSQGLTDGQWRLIMAAAEAVCRQSIPSTGLVWLAAMGVRGQLAQQQLMWNEVLAGLGASDQDLTQSYEALCGGRGEALTRARPPSDVARLLETPMVAAIESLGLPRDLQRLKRRLAIEPSVPAGPYDPWVGLTVDTIRSGGDGAEETFAWLEQQIQRHPVGGTPSGANWAGSTLWARETHFDFWMNDARRAVRAGPVLEGDIRSLIRDVTPVGQLYLVVVRTSLLGDKRAKEQIRALRFTDEALNDLRSAYRRKDRQRFQARAMDLGTQTLKAIIELKAEGLHARLNDKGAELSKRLAAEGIARLAELEGDLVRRVRDDRQWLVLLIRQLEQGRGVALLNGPEPVAAAYLRLVDALYANQPAPFDDVDQSLLPRLEEEALSQDGLADQPQIRILVEERMSTIQAAAKLPPGPASRKLSELLRRIATRLTNPAKAGAVDQVLLEAFRRADPQPFVDAAVMQAPREERRFRDADPFRDRSPWFAAATPLAVILVCAGYAAALVLRYWPESTQPLAVTATLPKPAFEPTSEGFVAVSVTGAQVWVMTHPVTRAKYADFVPLRDGGPGADTDTAEVTHGEAQTWCELYRDWLKSRNPGGLADGHTWNEVWVGLPDAADWPRLVSSQGARGPEWIEPARQEEASAECPVGVFRGGRDIVEDRDHLDNGIGFRVVIRWPNRG